MATLSFVSEELKLISSFSELNDYINESGGRILKNLDLSNVDCSGMKFDDYEIENVIFSHYSDKTDKKKRLSMVSFVRATLKNVSFAQSEMLRCNFDEAKLFSIDFFYSSLYYCRFRSVKGFLLDFRYSNLENCSMSTSLMVLCDYYMTNFGGSTSFLDSHYLYCSLTASSFQGNCMTMDNLSSIALSKEDIPFSDDGEYSYLYKFLIRRHKDINIVQDCYELYKAFESVPGWNKINPCGSHSYLNKNEKNLDELGSRIFIAREAMLRYSWLGGLYSGKGLFKDSNRAYRMSKIRELEYLRLSSKKAMKGPNPNIKLHIRYRLKSLGPLFSRFMGYGYKWSIIALWFVLLILGYSLYHFIRNSYSYMNSLTGSMNNSMGPNLEFISTLNEVIGSIEPAIGTLLVGFLGFVIANKIRNNS